MSIGADARFRAVALTVVPEAAAMTEQGWSQFRDVIDAALAKRPARVRRQLGLFLHILNLSAWLRYQRSLSGLSPRQREQLLNSFEQSRVLLFRRGLWGLRTLVFMGYYARVECGTSLGYAASARGWELRR